MIEFRLDARSGVAPYLQLVHQVRQALRLGMLREGDQLPTVKQVVAQVAMNPNTVLKAYRELEHEGLVAARPGLGTFVTRSLALAPRFDVVVGEGTKSRTRRRQYSGFVYRYVSPPRGRRRRMNIAIETRGA